MQRYLQYNTLQRKGLSHFDCWASTFGETVTAIELAPEGVDCKGGYSSNTNRHVNLICGKMKSEHAKGGDIWSFKAVGTFADVPKLSTQAKLKAGAAFAR